MTGTATGLDFGAVLALAAARGTSSELLAEALPEVETAMIAGMSGEPEEE